MGTRRRVMTSRSASPRPALADGRDGTVESIDPLAFLRADAATQATLAREVLPQCRQTTSVLKILERIEDACVARARLGVTDARRCETRSLAFVEPTIMQDALDRAIAEGNDLKDRASKMLVDFLNSGNREVLASRRRAMKKACEAKANALQLKKMSYDEAEALGKKVFNRAFTRDVSKRVSTLIFGPKFIASVAADLTQILNSSFTTYIATSSIDIFLPMVEEHEEKMRLKNEEDAQNAKEAAAEAAAAAVAALTVKNGFVRVTLSA